MPDDVSFRAWRQAWQLLEDQVDNLGDILEEEWKGSVNAIEELREFDCGGQWTVYLRTALPAVGEALWLLLIPALDEILEEYLNPKSGRGGSRRGRRSRRQWRAGNRGQRRLFFSNFIPDMDEEIARRIPGGERIRGRRIGPGEWLFFTGIDALDRVFWHWLVWEASQTFLTEWASELQESEQCKKAEQRFFNGGGNMSFVNVSDGFWNERTDWSILDELGWTVGSEGIARVPSETPQRGTIDFDVTTGGELFLTLESITFKFQWTITGFDENDNETLLYQNEKQVTFNSEGFFEESDGASLDFSGFSRLSFRQAMIFVDGGGGFNTRIGNFSISVQSQDIIENE